ncbi:MAG: VOC family protein [Solirubrobacteraceae bacterium]
MQLGGLHHITMITGDAPRNVEFYGEVLGLRLVKKTVNFDAPDAYHLYFGDEQGSPGSILTWFEFAGAGRGRPGAGMIHTIRLGVGSSAALGFWSDRLAAAGYEARPDGATLGFADYDGLQFTLEVSEAAPHRAEHPQIPAEHAICDIVGARAYGEVSPA